MSNLRQIRPKLFVGDDRECVSARHDPEFYILHACKTCHQRRINYHGSLPKTDPNYLFLSDGQNLYLNMIDTDSPDFFPLKLFWVADNWLTNHATDKVLVHCNKGESRAPSIVLCYMARHGAISNDSFEAAAKDYIKLDPDYKPSKGIAVFLIHNWEAVMRRDEQTT